MRRRPSGPGPDSLASPAEAGIVKITLPDVDGRSPFAPEPLHSLIESRQVEQMAPLPHAGEWVLEWIKREGEPVRNGETIAELHSLFNTLQVVSPVDGVLLRVFARNGFVAPNRVLAHVAHFRPRTPLRQRLLRFPAGILETIRGVFAARHSARNRRR